MSAHAIATGLREYSVRRWPTANHKFRKSRLADLLGFTERRVRSFWEAKAASPRDDEIDAIKALIGQEEESHAADEALSARIAELEAQVAFLVATLARDEVAAEGTPARRQIAGASSGSNAARGRRSAD